MVNDPTLFAKVRNYLDITWPDKDGDAKLAGIIERGMRYIDNIAGVPLDYLTEGNAQSLLLSYCRYDRSNASNEFAADYRHDLLCLQMQHRCLGEETEDSADDETDDPDV